MDKKLTDILKTLDGGRIHEACESIRNYVHSKQLVSLYDDIQAVSKEYNLLLVFARQGAEDAKREMLFNSITARLYRMCYDSAILEERKTAPFYLTQSKRLQEYDLNADSIRSRLEEYVSMTVMAEVDPTIDRASLAEEHHAYITALFSHLCLSTMWNSKERMEFTELLLSPTIDQNDCALIISAITLACNAFFDHEKWLTLTNIYLSADDEMLRQRAFVGWALTASGIGNDKECHQRLCEICDSSQRVQSIMLLQKELLYCSNTLKDNEKIKNDILPNILKSKANPLNGFNLDDLGMDNDVDAEIEAIDEVENYYRQIKNMEREGSDVFYSGFAQMKRYAFFYNISNWFAPFNIMHPDLTKATGKDEGIMNMMSLMRNINLCDSDRYSMALGLPSILRMMGENMKELAELGLRENATEGESPTTIRRHYLQDLFRFFNLYPQKHCFHNPLNTIFITCTGFENTPVKDQMLGIIKIMEKLHMDKKVDEVFAWCMRQQTLIQSTEMQMAIAHRCVMNKKWTEAKVIFFFLYTTGTKTEEVIRGLAYCHMMDREYDYATNFYKELIEKYPNKKRYKMYYLLVMTRQGKAQEVINDVFQLNFEASEGGDEQMLFASYRLLAWTLLCIGRYEEAIRHYNFLKTKNMRTKSDILHQGMALWLANYMQDALQELKEWVLIHNEENNDSKGKDGKGDEGSELPATGKDMTQAIFVLEDEIEKCKPMLAGYDKTDTDLMILCELIRLDLLH